MFDKAFEESLNSAVAAGCDRNKLLGVMAAVATGQITDFYTEDFDADENIVVTNVPQMDAPKKHCRLQRVPHSEN